MPSAPAGPSAPERHASHHPDRSATTEVVRPHGRHQLTPARSSTAPTLFLISETDNGIVDERLRTYLNHSQAHLPRPTVATTIPLEATSTSDPPSVPSSSGNTFGPSFAHTSPRVVSSGGSGGLPTSPASPTPGSHALLIKYGPDGAVKAATLSGLVERLIDSKDFSKDLEFRQTFLTSYRAFSSTEEVFSLLLERFEAVSSPQYTTKQRVNMRLSVLAVLDLWLEGGYMEEKDLDLLDRMRVFATSIQASSSVPPFRDSVQRLIQLIDIAANTFLSPVPPLAPSSSSSFKLPLTSSVISPQDLALVLTSIEGDRYRKVTDSDCIAWLEGMHESNKLSSFIAENKKLSYWAQKSILEFDQQAPRSEQFKYFSCIAEECRKLRNFSSSCALLEGLLSPSITGLKRTSALDKSRAKLIFREKTFQEYRKALSASMAPESKGHWFRKAPKVSLELSVPWASMGPCIPWLYAHLRDFKSIHEAHQKFVKEDGHADLINFDRCHRVRDGARHVLSYQEPALNPTNSARHAKIQSFVEAQLRSFVVDDTLDNWLQERGTKLAREEKADYFDYGGHKKELVAGGYLRPTTFTSPPKPPRGSKPASPRPSSSTYNSKVSSPITPTMGTLLSQFPQIPDGTMGEVFSLDMLFNKKSKFCLDGRIARPSQHTVVSGGFSDIREGFLGNQKVAIKTIRPFSNMGKRIEDDTLRKRIWREYTSWTRVSHPNVLECLGFSYDFSPKPHIVPSLISPWMSNGTLDTHLKNYPDTDRLELLIAIANGLSYLHEQDIIHGDLRAGNILVSDSGQPRLSDFGLSRILKLEGMTATSEPAGSLRWMSPELLRDHTVASVSSDVWAYGMTALEIMSGNRPFHQVKIEPSVMHQILNGQIPSRPQDTKTSDAITDEVWSICQQCWIFAPAHRPTMPDVSSKIRRITH